MRPMRWKQPAPMVCTPAQRRQSNSALLGRQVQIIPDFIILIICIIFHLFYWFSECVSFISGEELLWKTQDLIMEGRDMFWGLVVKPGKRYESKVIEFLNGPKYAKP